MNDVSCYIVKSSFIIKFNSVINISMIARSEYGLMVQILGGLITYLLMAIYCREQFNEKVSIKRVRELRTSILNGLINGPQDKIPASGKSKSKKIKKIEKDQNKQKPNRTLLTFFSLFD